MSLASRFWSKVDRRGPDECWPWKGATDGRTGYGRLWDGGKVAQASRISYQLHVGPIPGGLLVLHACDVPGCVNPRHLGLGNQRDNMREMVARGRSARGGRHWTHLYPELRLKGTRNPAAKLTAAQITAAARSWARGHSAARIGRTYGVSPSTIRRALLSMRG